MSFKRGHGSVFVLGTHDAEMAAIEQLFVAACIPYAYAHDEDGSRTAYQDAYRASTVSNPLLVESAESIIPIECCIPTYKSHYAGRIDHHRPKDPGYEGDPSDAWLLSSLGQVANHPLLSTRIEPHLKPYHYAIGAIDDNPRAVFNDLVPEVRPNAAFAVLIDGIAKEHGISFETAYRKYKAGLSCFNALPMMPMWDSEVRDARTSGIRIPIYNSQERLFQFARAYRAGVGIMTHCVDKPGGLAKVTVNNADELGVNNFIDWAEQMVLAGELRGTYGQARRGYAGAYINPKSDYALQYGLYLNGSKAYNHLVQATN